VVVLAVALLGVPVRVEHRTRTLKRRLVDQGLVGAVVFDTRVADDPDVVGVGEHHRELRARQRFRRACRGGAGEQPAVGERILEGIEGVGAGRVCRETPADVRCAFGVDLHGADFASLDHLADVEVADWCAGGGASGLGLLDESLACLGGEVGGVELGVCGDDRVHEPPERRVIDVLGH
jgi:hypothetical protein